MTLLVVDEVIQYAREATGGWTWYCPAHNAWGSAERLSFAFTAGEAHKKVSHHHDD